MNNIWDWDIDCQERGLDNIMYYTAGRELYNLDVITADSKLEHTNSIDDDVKNYLWGHFYYPK